MVFKPRGFRFVPSFHLLAALCTLWLAACGTEETSDPGPTIQRFEVTPEHLEVAGHVTLQWRTTGAATLELRQGELPIDLGELDIAQGTIAVEVTENTTFTLEAKDAAGRVASVNREVTVDAPQNPLIGALDAPELVEANAEGEATATIGWSGVERADTLSLRAEGRAPIDLDPEAGEGSVEVLLTETTTFHLVATNEADETSRSVTIRVAYLPVIESFEAERRVVGLGESTVVHWITAGASHVELWQDGVKLEAPSDPQGSLEIAFNLSSTLELRAFNELETSEVATLDIDVGSPEIVLFESDADVRWLGESVTLSWETLGGSSLDLHLDPSGERLCEVEGYGEIAKSSCEWQPSETGVYSVVLTISNFSGSLSSTLEIYVGDGPLITHFGAGPAALTADDEVELSWIVRDDPAGNPPTLRLTDDRGNTYEAISSEGLLFAPLLAPGPYEFQLEATTDHPNSSANIRAASVLVHPRPTVSLVATPTLFDDSIHDEVILSWTTQDAETLILYRIEDDVPQQVHEALGADREAGSFTFVPREERSYRLIATNTIGGQRVQDITIPVAPTEVLSFTVDPPSFAQGQPVTLRWTTRMADEVQLNVGSKDYLLEELDAPYLDLPALGGTRTPLTAECGAIDTLGCAAIYFPDDFRFAFGGSTHDRVWVYTLGYLAFSSGVRPDSRQANEPFPSDPQYQGISMAPFWDSIAWDSTRYPTGNIYSALLEEDGERIFVIQWRDIGHTSYRTASFNFEVALREDGSFDYRYGEQSARDSNISNNLLAGSTATIGFQLPDQSDYNQLLYNGAGTLNGLRDHRTFSFRPRPALPLSGELVLRPLGPQATFPLTLTATRDGVSHSRTENLTVARRPILELTSGEIAPVAMEEEFRIGWKSINVESLVVVDAAGVTRCTAPTQEQIDEGLCALSESAGGTYEYTVRATGAHGTVAERTIEVLVFGAFGVATFTSEAASVERGDDVLLQWLTFATESVSLLANGVEIYSDASGALTGSFLVQNVEQQTEFKLIATNDVGATDEAILDVGIWPITFGLQASRTSVRAGDEITVSLDAKALDGGAPQRVYGMLPMVEVPGTADRYEDISTHEDAVLIPYTPAVNLIELPFPFPFMGEAQNSVSMTWHGYVSFTPGISTWPTNYAFPSTQSNSIYANLAPFWDNLQHRNVGQMHAAQTSADTFVIQWSKFSMSSGSTNANPQNLNFQIVLHRNGSFDYRYGTMAPQPNPAGGCFPNTCVNEVAGSSATIGYQEIGAGAGHNLHFGGTNPAVGNLPFLGGLSDRTFRYQVVEGAGSFTFYPNESETFTFCADIAGETICKELEIEVPFGFTSVALSKEELNPGESTSLSWQSVGGKSVRILDGDTVVHSTSDLAEVDAGSAVLTPAQTTVYTVELSAGGRLETVQKVIEVERFSLTSSITASTGPGTPVTLSWNLSGGAAGADLHVLAPLEQITSGFDLYNLAYAEGVTQLIGTDVDNTAANLSFTDFSFPFFGEEYTSLRVYTDGYLGVATTGNSTANNQVLPSTNTTYATVALAPFWEDLHTRVNGRVLAKKFDDDRYVIQWSQVSLKRGSENHNEGDLNFLVVLHRNGSFEYHFGFMRPPALPATVAADCIPSTCENETNGSAATIGYQIPGGAAANMLHYGGLNPGAGQPIVAGGLTYRSWRFTPQTTTGPGSAVVHPADSGSYTICAYESVSTELICAPAAPVDAPWGIDLFQINPTAPMAGQPVTLSWSVRNLESLRILANGNTLLEQTGSEVQLLGTFNHTPLAASTTYVLEGTSMMRTAVEERVVHLRTFDLTVNGPSGIFVPGETVVVDWTLTKHVPDDVVMINPMSELEIGPGGEGGYVDVSQLEGAEEIALTGGTQANNGHADVTLPFPFPYLGTEQTTLQVFVDGYISFVNSGGNSNGINAVLPNDGSSQAKIQMAVFWDDLILRGGDSVWRYSPDPDTLIIQWKGFSRSSGTSGSIRYDLNFQVVLRADGSFDYRYGTMAPPPPPFSDPSCSPDDCSNEANGSSATIGYQSVDARYGVTLHVGSLYDSSANRIDSVDGGGGFSGDGFLVFPGGLEGRAFRYSPAPTGSARVVVGRTSDQQVCAIIGAFAECKSVRIGAVASSGELMITEVMIDPSGGLPGQWLEVRNLTNRTIDMEGFDLRSHGGSHRIQGSLSVAPGTFVTLANSTQVPFTPDYVYGGDVPLNRLIDRLDLMIGQATINTVTWGISWSVPRNQVLSLDPSLHLAGIQENPDFASWCHTGPLGTPGTLGNGCLDPWYDIDPASHQPFIDIGATGTRFYDIEGNNLLARLPSPGFPTQFFGETHGRVWVATNGWISFSDLLPATTTTTLAPNLPRTVGQTNSLKGPLFAGFWDRLYCRSHCRIYYEVREVSGEKVLIVQWEGFFISGNTAGTVGGEGSITFQIQVWEEGDLAVVFGAVDNPYPLGTSSWASYEGSTAASYLESADPNVLSIGHHKRPLGLEYRSIYYRAK